VSNLNADVFVNTDKCFPNVRESLMPEKNADISNNTILFGYVEVATSKGVQHLSTENHG
jgi:hypothetical protein